MAGSTLHLNEKPTDTTSVYEYGTRFAVQQSHGMQGFISNLRDFFLERPIKIRGDAKNPFQPTTFGASVGDNLKGMVPPASGVREGP
jgi:hypothetical protein